MVTLGDKIRKLRKEKGLSQEELGFSIGVARQTISKWEANLMCPNIENIKALSAFFGIDSGYFMEDSQDVLQQEVAAGDDPKGPNIKKYIFLLVGAIVFAVLSLACIVLCAIFAFAAFSSNVGFNCVQNSTQVDIWNFIIVLCLAILFLIVSIFFSVIRHHKKIRQ